MKQRYALVFQVKRSPFPKAPCYLYRYAHERHLRHVARLPDTDVDDDRMEAMQEAIDAAVDGCEEELYSDAELARNSEYDCTAGFFVGVTRRALQTALERDGFTVLEIDQPRWRVFHGSTAMCSADDVAELSRQLTRCSLAGLLGERERQFHAEAIGKAVRNTLPRRSKWLVEQVRRASADWTRPMSDCFHLITAVLGLNEPFVGVLPRVSDREVARLCAAAYLFGT